MFKQSKALSQNRN